MAQVCAKECLAPKDYSLWHGWGLDRPRAPSASDWKCRHRPRHCNLKRCALKSPRSESPGVARYKPPLSHATLSGVLEPAVAAPGSVARLVISAEPAADWHIYALAGKSRKRFAKPTLIVVTEPAWLR